MGFDEAMRDAFYALFGFVVLLQAWFGLWGVVRLWRLHAGLPPLRRRRWLRGFTDFPDDQMSAAIGPAISWRHALAWNDLCASIGGVAAAFLAIPVATALPISNTNSIPDSRDVLLAMLALAFSGVGSVIGRCAAITWVTPPAGTIGEPPLSRGRRQVTVEAMAIWATDVLFTLLVAAALATTVQTPRANDYIVPAYIALVLLFPVLLGIALAAEWWLGRGWRALIHSVLSAAPNLSQATERDFRAFAGMFMTGRALLVGFFVGLSEFYVVILLTSLQPYYFGRLSVVTMICGMAAMLIAIFTWIVPITTFTLPREEDLPAVPDGVPAS